VPKASVLRAVALLAGVSPAAASHLTGWRLWLWQELTVSVAEPLTQPLLAQQAQTTAAAAANVVDCTDDGSQPQQQQQQQQDASSSGGGASGECDDSEAAAAALLDIFRALAGQ
jgi:hypothetical protein